VDHERDRLLASYHGIRTKFDAVKYLHGVSKRYQEARQQRGGSP
jgi:hypothetical protein